MATKVSDQFATPNYVSDVKKERFPRKFANHLTVYKCRNAKEHSLNHCAEIMSMVLGTYCRHETRSSRIYMGGAGRTVHQAVY